MAEASMFTMETISLVGREAIHWCRDRIRRVRDSSKTEDLVNLTRMTNSKTMIEMIKRDMLINLVDRVVVAATPTKRTTIATPTSISRAIKAIGKVRKEPTAISNTKGMTKFRKETVNGWKIRFSILEFLLISRMGMSRAETGQRWRRW